MGRQAQKRGRNVDQQLEENYGSNADRSPAVKKAPPLRAQNDSQQRYINAIKNSTLTFATGPAGTGKTYIAAALAAEALEKGEVTRIVITRPAVEAGEELGALPGELEQKFDPYLQPFREALNERMGRGTVDYAIKAGRIEAAPLAYMRGRTFSDAFVILDEAQNTSPTQMKMFLTRIGRNCTVIVNGDVAQKDIRGESGIEEAVLRLRHIPEVRHVHFSTDDIVRSGIVGEIVKAYNQPREDFQKTDLY